MWQCSKCGREFAKNNQGHYCLDTETIDDYIKDQPEEVRPILEKLRKTIKGAAPKSVEKMSWKMPTFWQNENLIHFSAQKNHLGIHPGALDHLSDDLIKRLVIYKTSKGSIQFPYDKPIDYELIKDITLFRVSCVMFENK